MGIASLSFGTALAALAAGIAIVGAAIATAIVQSTVGSAGMGMLSEKSENSGMALLFYVLPETILVFGFVIAILILLGAGFI